ncbi:MAG: hypothetical protein HOP37_03760 [Cyclobacteriaceae bacterium]|nr:hypothetical protein [Cyclobacteriaceae bacterium]
MSWISKQPWLGNARIETWFILLPPLAPLVLLFFFQSYFATANNVSTIWLLVLVLGIDVSHVYSTTFRFYWEPSLLKKYRTHLVIIPIAALAIGTVLHFIDALFFWRILAYMAVFHFVRQQYGFMRLYARQETQNRLNKTIDMASIYAATLYPLLYWHIHRTSDLSWFIAGDFFDLSFIAPISVGLAVVYLLILTIYVAKEAAISIKSHQFNVPKNLVMLGTYASWYVGIITAKGDLTFTLMNVVAHGIPYMALVWLYGHREKKVFSLTIPWRQIGVFIGCLLLLAYLEETLWDILIWKDHPNIFPFFQGLPRPSAWVVSILVPLLSLPQITHYVIDGFIWKSPVANNKP